MGFRFLAADKVTDPESAERILTKYRNREISMSLDAQSFEGTLLNVKAANGTLRVEFVWNQDEEQNISDVEHVQRYAKSRVGSMVRFKVSTDEFVGLLSGLTEMPEGATLERYIDSPFVLTFAFTANDQRPLTADFSGSGIIGVPVPLNVAEQLPLDEDLPYEPHITVCFFPEISTKDAEKLLPLAMEVAEIVGSFDVQVDGSTTFPTPQDDETYPHVARIKSQGLTDFHDLFVEMCEHRYPGMVDTTFALKNYNPHVTLSYQKDPNAVTVLPALAWNVDHLTLNLGKKDKFPIPLTEAGLKVAKWPFGKEEEKPKEKVSFRDWLFAVSLELEVSGPVPLMKKIPVKVLKGAWEKGISPSQFHHYYISGMFDDEISKHQRRAESQAAEKPYFQLGDTQIAITVVGNEKGDLRVRLKDSNQAERFGDMEGEKVLFVTSNAKQELDIVEIRESGPDGFQVFYRRLVTHLPKSARSKLRYVAAIAEERGLRILARKVSKLVTPKKTKKDSKEPEDKEALGPGFEGTDEHIVTYVKAPQTQVIVEEPKFSRSLPLHERI